MPLPPVVTRILNSGAPTLLTALALPPPFNLIASGIVSGVLSRFLPPGEAPEQKQPNGAPALSPAQVTRVIEANSNDPKFLVELKQAENQLRQYELEHDLKFAELAVQDRTRAGEFQLSSGIGPTLLRWGMGIVVVAIVAMLGIVIGSILLVTGTFQISAEHAQLAVGVFGLIVAVVGYISGYGGQIISFYYGSSQGSKDKSESLTTVLREQGQQLGQAAATAATAATTATAATARALTAATAAPQKPQTAAIQWRRGPFGGLRWQLTADGILDEGETVPTRTVGEPITVRRIWRDFGDIIRRANEAHGVPVEVVVTTIAVESRGITTAALTEPDGRTSVGLMQTLTATASEMLKREVTADELQTPEVSIEAGVLYIASKRAKTLYDPILVAAAYNAGDLLPPREQDNNPYRLRSTGDHLVRTKLYYNDTVFVAKQDNWFA